MCVSGYCTMDLTSTREFKKRKVQERLEPRALDLRAGDGAKLKRTAIVSRSTAAKGERGRQRERERECV